MPNKRDFYAAHAIRNSQDVIALYRRRDLDALTKIRLASGGYADDLVKGAAREMYLRLAHRRGSESELTRQLDKIREMLAQSLLPTAFSLMETATFKKLRLPAFLIEFYFTLATPLLTRDETGHYPIDNPLRKDTAIQLPVLAASSWKGLLHSAFLECQLYPAWKQWNNRRQDETLSKQYLHQRWRMLRLFGSEKEHGKDQPVPEMLKKNEGEWEKFLKERFKKPGEPSEQVLVPPICGSLHTFPTFFSSMDVEVINPHDGIRRVGTQPIYLEVVPSGSIGLFRLLYLQRPGMLLPDEKSRPEEVASTDLQATLQTIALLLCEFGIAGKRSAGYGQTEKTLPMINGNQGRLVQNFRQPPADDGWRRPREHRFSNFQELTELKIDGES